MIFLESFSDEMVGQIMRYNEIHAYLSHDTRLPTMWHFESVDSDEPLHPAFRVRNLK